MPKLHAPKYLRRRERPPRSDRAITIIDGKRYYLGVYGSDESYRKFAELTGAVEKAEPKPAEPAPAEPTLNFLMVDFMRFAIEHYGGEGNAHVHHYRAAFRVLRETCGASPVKDFGPKLLKQARAAMIAKGWSRTHINAQCNKIRRFIAWCIEEELLEPTPKHVALSKVSNLREGDYGARETECVEPIPDLIVAVTMVELPDAVRDMVMIARLTGMRPGEVVQLSRKHVDRSGTVWLFKPPQHKSKKKRKTRSVAIGPEAQAILAKHLFREPCFGYSTASFRRAIHRAADKAGVRRWGPHRLRHSRATEIRHLHDLESAQVALGQFQREHHADVRRTQPGAHGGGRAGERVGSWARRVVG